MNETASLSPRSLLSLLLALLLAACSASEGEAPPLQGAAIGGPFTLTDQNGQKVSDTDFKGKYRLVYFGYTFCPDICPVDMQVVGQGLRQFEQSDPEAAAQVQPIFISVDPERDDPAALKEFAAAFHPRLVGLTGTPEEIAAVSKTFGVYAMKQDREGSSEYLVNHSRLAFLFGPNGAPIALLPHEQGADAIAAEIKRWVR